jgi:hypothetical protein
MFAYMNVHLYKYPLIRVSAYMNIRLYECLLIQMSAYTNVRLYEYPLIRMSASPFCADQTLIQPNVSRTDVF